MPVFCILRDKDFMPHSDERRDNMPENNVSHNNQKKIAAINDYSGFGRCSIAVELPVISAMKIQCLCNIYMVRLSISFDLNSLSNTMLSSLFTTSLNSSWTSLVTVNEYSLLSCVVTIYWSVYTVEPEKAGKHCIR